MIGLRDVYLVLSAMVPLYIPLGLGYGSVRWWGVLNPEHCNGINRVVALFTLPLFTFNFTASIDPFTMNFRFLGADALSKVFVVAAVALWAKTRGTCCKGPACSWAITGFSLSTLTNTLVVGVPLLKAMYGGIAQDLVVQVSVIQAIVWLSILLFVLECRSSCINGGVVVASETVGNEGSHVAVDVAGTDTGVKVVQVHKRPSLGSLMKVVWRKLALNPNSYASIVGVIWAFISSRWHFSMPLLMENSVSMMAKAGSGMAMFSMGLFMASQEKLIGCGPSLTVLSMVLRFLAGPAAMAVASIAVGLHGDVLHIAIIQAALPQSITSFIYAREYGLHAEVLSTAVIFGMLVSLPVLIAYYVVLELLR
ncbi:hypothetical protein AMTRI_Chr06g194750 [Amborella trichopoda]|uniref:Auxin efflux carrier component n=1 Tax=Amborella trichopoda TaxID=13333 RepID=W1PQN4_AMBTC|nr:auxin efflux carrier component 5 [Amborella trichopoda]ERN10021.1 hypothetical protein AMTR_s00013p00241000 [Amborella trichopoda]|eukprot:XP_006848440.1 auxin efflux carrier component 5 [Amborella trichopoda]